MLSQETPREYTGKHAAWNAKPARQIKHQQLTARTHRVHGVLQHSSALRARNQELPRTLQQRQQTLTNTQRQQLQARGAGTETQQVKLPAGTPTSNRVLVQVPAALGCCSNAFQMPKEQQVKARGSCNTCGSLAGIPAPNCPLASLQL